MGRRNVSLTARLSGFVDKAVRSGRHQNASEVVREALRRYEDDVKAEEASLTAIEAVAEQGAAAIARGEFTAIEGPADARALVQRLNRRAAQRAMAIVLAKRRA